MKKKIENKMTKLEIFMLYELINKATFNVKDGIPMNWFDEIVEDHPELTEKEKFALMFNEGSLIGVKI